MARHVRVLLAGEWTWVDAPDDREAIELVAKAMLAEGRGVFTNVGHDHEVIVQDVITGIGLERRAPGYRYRGRYYDVRLTARVKVIG